MASLLVKRILAVLGLMTFGALNTLTSKILYTISVTMGSGPFATVRYFRKPFFVTFMMFCAMTLVLLAHLYFKDKKKKADEKEQPLVANGSEKHEEASELKAFFYIGIPASFDMVATAMMLYGLTLMSASIYQMLRGSLIIFSSLICRFVRQWNVPYYQWVGVAVCILGITCVGASNILNDTSGESGPAANVSPFWAAFGIFLVCSSQCFQATQVVVEEKLLKDVKLPVMQIVGYEGLWGVMESLILMFPFIYMIPGDDHGHLEDTVESFEMIPRSGALQGLILLYLFSCSTFNIASIQTTQLFNAVHRTMLEAVRTAVIWIFDLTVFYLVNSQLAFGEEWLPYSWLELTGFCLVIIGQCTYGGIIPLPGFDYSTKPGPKTA